MEVRWMAMQNTRPLKTIRMSEGSFEIGDVDHAIVRLFPNFDSTPVEVEQCLLALKKAGAHRVRVEQAPPRPVSVVEDVADPILKDRRTLVEEMCGEAKNVDNAALLSVCCAIMDRVGIK